MFSVRITKLLMRGPGERKKFFPAPPEGARKSYKLRLFGWMNSANCCMLFIVNSNLLSRLSGCHNSSVMQEKLSPSIISKFRNDKVQSTLHATSYMTLSLIVRHKLLLKQFLGNIDILISAFYSLAACFTCKNIRTNTTVNFTS